MFWTKRYSQQVLQNSQENTCARVSILMTRRPKALHKNWSIPLRISAVNDSTDLPVFPVKFVKFLTTKETLLQVFSCEFCEIFRNPFFCRTPLGHCFWNSFVNICCLVERLDFQSYFQHNVLKHVLPFDCDNAFYLMCGNSNISYTSHVKEAIKYYIA